LIKKFKKHECKGKEKPEGNNNEMQVSYM
jgi:hypothetical protein